MSFSVISALTDVRWNKIVVLICISLINNIKHLFTYLLAIYMFFWEENIYSGLLPIFNQIFFFWYWGLWAVYIFWILTCYQLYHLQIFSPHLVGCLFILLMVSFALFLSLTRPHLFIFAFVFFALVDRSRKPLLWSMSRGILPVIFGLTFRSLIHFEFIFVYGIRECSNFLLLNVFVQFCQQHLLKRLFLHCIFLLSLNRLIYHISVASFWVFLFHFIDLYICSYAILFWLLWLCTIAWNIEAWYHLFSHSFLRWCWVFRVFCVSVQVLVLFILDLWKSRPHRMTSERFPPLQFFGVVWEDRYWLFCKCLLLVEIHVMSAIGIFMGLHWIYRLPQAVWVLLHSVDMVYLSSVHVILNSVLQCLTVFAVVFLLRLILKYFILFWWDCE